MGKITREVVPIESETSVKHRTFLGDAAVPLARFLTVVLWPPCRWTRSPPPGHAGGTD